MMMMWMIICIECGRKKVGYRIIGIKIHYTLISFLTERDILNGFLFLLDFFPVCFLDIIVQQSVQKSFDDNNMHVWMVDGKYECRVLSVVGGAGSL